MPTTKKAAPKTLALSGAYTVDRAAGLKSELQALLAGQEPAFVSLSELEELDLACLQVLYAARRSAKASGKEFHLEGTVKPRVAKRLVACGFLRGFVERAEDFEAGLLDF